MSQISMRPLLAAITCAMVLAASLLVIEPDNAGAAPLGFVCETNTFLATNHRFTTEVDGPGPIELVTDNGGTLTSRTVVTEEQLLSGLPEDVFGPDDNQNIPEGVETGVFVFKVNQIGMTEDGVRAILTVSLIKAEKGENGLAKGNRRKMPRKNFIINYPINDTNETIYYVPLPDDPAKVGPATPSAVNVAGAVNPVDNKYYFGTTRKFYPETGGQRGFEYRVYDPANPDTAPGDPIDVVWAENNDADLGRGGNGDYIFDPNGVMHVLRSKGKYKSGVDATWVYKSDESGEGPFETFQQPQEAYQTSGQNGLANGRTGTTYTSNVHGGWTLSDAVTENQRVEALKGTTDLAGCFRAPEDDIA